MLPLGSYFGMNGNSATGMMFSSNSSIMNNNPVINQAGNSSSALLLDSVPGLKHDVGLAVEWSVDEQYRLEEGLAKYADEPNIMKYIKIAAMLRDKTVRDVALRVRWMMRKRRKPDEHMIGKKVNNRKDKLVESSSKANGPASLALDMTGYPLIINNMGQNQYMSSEDVLSHINGPAKYIFEQNAQAFHQISANLSMYKLQENIDLLSRTRNNITTIMNDMRHMPGIMSRMPPLPVSIDEELANNILPSTI
ncbi:hypothetical protein UlMin_040396 [Ulmus minor]